MIKHYNLGEKKNNKKCLKVWRKQVSPAIMGLKQLLIFYERKSFGLPAFIEDNTETSRMVFQSWTNVIWQRLIEKWLESFERKMKSVNFYNISLVLLLYIGQSLHKRNPGNHSLCSTDDKYNIVSKVRENSFFFAICHNSFHSSTVIQQIWLNSTFVSNSCLKESYPS